MEQYECKDCGELGFGDPNIDEMTFHTCDGCGEVICFDCMYMDLKKKEYCAACYDVLAVT